MIDEHDRRLLLHVQPPGHQNPLPARMYDLVVIGGGTAGLVCAAGAAGLGARVALVERNRLGGDCLNTGCVPSKALLRSASVVEAARGGSALGVPASAAPEFTAVMARMRARRADLAPHDSAGRLVSLGVDVFLGTARFASRRSVTVHPHAAHDVNASPDAGPRELRFRRAVIATGSRPAVPSIPGLAGTPFLTNETIFDLTSLPPRMAIVGAGPVGCEMAQAFARLGTTVTLFDSAMQVLPREDADAAAIVAARLREDGVTLHLGTAIRTVRHDGRTFVLDHGAETTADVLLVAAGRTPGVDGLAASAAGVRTGPGGVIVDERLRTSNSRVYAAGDVCSPYRFTHAADAMARIVVENALFYGRKRFSRLAVPWCTYTTPEVAHVGTTSSDAGRLGARTVTIPLSKVDRAVVDERTAGFVRVHHLRGRIVGATVVGPAAAELIATIALLMPRRRGLAELASAVVPYPSMAGALRQAGDEYRREALTPGVRTLLRYYFRAFTPGTRL